MEWAEETTHFKQFIMIHTGRILCSITMQASDQSCNSNLWRPTMSKSATNRDVARKCKMQNWTAVGPTLWACCGKHHLVSGLHVDECGPIHDVPRSCSVLQPLASNTSVCGFIIQVRNTLLSKVSPQENKVMKFSAHVHHPFRVCVWVHEWHCLYVFISQYVCVWVCVR